MGGGFTISDFQPKDQVDLTLEEINEGSCLKDDVTFALFITIFPHIVTMFNELLNFLGWDVILNGEPIGLENHGSRQCGL